MEQKISIIVPVYNAEKTLDRCVRSLENQTYTNLEILLVNDGSKDGSLGICSRYAREDTRVRVIDKPNGGVSSARNAGLDVAEGAFVMFCDSDDWVEPDWCASLWEHYVPGSLAVCEILREDVPARSYPVEEETIDRKRYLHNNMLMCALYNKIFDAVVIRENRIRFSHQLSLGEDFVFCLDYLCKIPGDIRYLYRGLYHYDTSNTGSLSGKAPALEQCELFYRSVAGALEQLGIDDTESLTVRDTFAASHFERYLKSAAANRKLSIPEKMAAASRTGKTLGFRETCARGIRWGNPFYVWLMSNGCVRLGMLLLIAKDLRKPR